MWRPKRGKWSTGRGSLAAERGANGRCEAGPAHCQGCLRLAQINRSARFRNQGSDRHRHTVRAASLPNCGHFIGENECARAWLVACHQGELKLATCGRNPPSHLTILPQLSVLSQTSPYQQCAWVFIVKKLSTAVFWLGRFRQILAGSNRPLTP